MGFIYFMYYCGLFTLPSTGVITILGLPFTPTSCRFTIADMSVPVLSAGQATSSSVQEANTTHFDVVPTGETLSDNTKCIQHRQRIGGVLTVVLAASFVSFGIKRFKVNVTTANPSLQVFGEFWG